MTVGIWRSERLVWLDDISSRMSAKVRGHDTPFARYETHIFIQFQR